MSGAIQGSLSKVFNLVLNCFIFNYRVFIRAPAFKDIGEYVEVLATLPNNDGDGPKDWVAVRQDNIMATSFHPELTEDDRFHSYFMDLVVNSL